MGFDGVARAMPALLHLVVFEMIMLPLFSFAVFSFLTEGCADILLFMSDSAEYKDLETRECLVMAYRSALWTADQTPIRGCGPSGTHFIYVPILLNWSCFLIVAGLWLGTVAYFLRRLPLSTRFGEGKYLRFLWKSRTASSYRRTCLVLEILACLAIVSLLAAAFGIAGIKGVIWALQKKFLPGILVVISMRQFTRPELPAFHFRDEAGEAFERMEFNLTFFLNSNAIVHKLHAEFCKTYAQEEIDVVDGHDNCEAVKDILRKKPPTKRNNVMKEDGNKLPKEEGKIPRDTE